MNKYQIYFKRYAICAIVASLPLFLNLIFVINAYENIKFNRVVEIQQKLNAIYGPRLNDNLFLYKKELFKFKKPAIIALGSSRVIQLREQCFNANFANCGLAGAQLNEVIVFLEEILKINRPEMILLGLDFWWFNGAYQQPKSFPRHNQEGTDNLLFKIKQPFLWLTGQNISFKLYIDVAIFNNNKNTVTKYENMGTGAIKFSEGWRKDGSYINSGIVFGFLKLENLNALDFKTLLDKIQRGIHPFGYSDRVSPERLQQFQRIMEICRENQIALIVLLPPVSPTIYKKMQSISKQYAYVEELRNYLQTAPVEFYDFHDISAISPSDCEFFDGTHCGDVLYQKMLLKIVEENPDSALKRYVNIPLIEEKSKEFSGHVVTKFNKSRYYYDEVDFLELGCKK